MIDPNDGLGELLAPKPSQASVELRERLLRKTEGRLVYSRRVRSAIRIGSIACVFLLGGLGGWLARPAPVSLQVPLPQPEVVYVPVPMVIPIPTPTENVPNSSAEIARPPSGHDTELQAEQEDDPKTAAGLYKLAGDAFLREQNYPNATRCYRLFLVRAGDAALSIDPDDSWLLTSLKNAFFQEKSHVSKTDS